MLYARNGRPVKPLTAHPLDDRRDDVRIADWIVLAGGWEEAEQVSMIGRDLHLEELVLLAHPPAY